MEKRKAGLTQVQRDFVCSSLESASHVVYELTLNIVLCYGAKSYLAKKSKKTFLLLLDVFRELPALTDYGESNVDDADIINAQKRIGRDFVFDLEKHVATGEALRSQHDALCAVSRCLYSGCAKSNAINKIFHRFIRSFECLVGDLCRHFEFDVARGVIIRGAVSPYFL